MRVIGITFALCLLAGLGFALAGCGSGGDPAAPEAMTTAATVRVSSAAGGTATVSTTSGGGSSMAITFAELRAELAEGTRRVEIEFEEPEVEVEDDALDDEEIESRIVAIEVDAEARTGRVTLELGNLVVEFSAAATEFQSGSSDDTALQFDEFVGRVRAALDRGERLAVEVERDPRLENGLPLAQAPGDPTFVAREIELEGEGQPEIEINVDADNTSEATLLTCGLDQGIQVLGVCIAIVPGVTEIELEN